DKLVTGVQTCALPISLHAGYLELEVVPTVPAPVLAETWRGGPRSAPLSRLLAMCDVEPMVEDDARRVGDLAGRARHHDVVDVARSEERRVGKGGRGGG